jgi:hypothetical protein
MNQTWQNLEEVVVNAKDGVQYSVQRIGELASTVLAARLTQKMVLGTAILAITSAMLYIPAALGYLALYYRYLPEMMTTVPVHLQYGYVAFLEGLFLVCTVQALTCPASAPTLSASLPSRASLTVSHTILPSR